MKSSPDKYRRTKKVAGIAAVAALAASALLQSGEQKKSHESEKPKVTEKADAGVKKLQEAFGEAAALAAKPPQPEKPDGSLLDGGPPDEEIETSLMNDVIRELESQLPVSSHSRDQEFNADRYDLTHYTITPQHLSVRSSFGAHYEIFPNVDSGNFRIEISAVGLAVERHYIVDGVVTYKISFLIKELDSFRELHNDLKDYEFFAEGYRKRLDAYKNWQKYIDEKVTELLSRYGTIQKSN
ncbi:hypothetical protein HYW83_00530 [Candidatus Peregrinibacteria bacterium]|nr:hypothetical protein [Candidatus Peregrinibacteria bacterium]